MPRGEPAGEVEGEVGPDRRARDRRRPPARRRATGPRPPPRAARPASRTVREEPLGERAARAGRGDRRAGRERASWKRISRSRRRRSRGAAAARRSDSALRAPGRRWRAASRRRAESRRGSARRACYFDISSRARRNHERPHRSPSPGRPRPGRARAAPPPRRRPLRRLRRAGRRAREEARALARSARRARPSSRSSWRASAAPRRSRTVHDVQTRGLVTAKTPEGDMSMEVQTSMIFPDRIAQQLDAPFGRMAMVATPDGRLHRRARTRSRTFRRGCSDELLKQVRRVPLLLAQKADDPKLVVAAAGTEKIGDVEARILDVAYDGATVRWFLDPTTYRILRSAHTSVGPQGEANDRLGLLRLQGRRRLSRRVPPRGDQQRQQGPGPRPRGVQDQSGRRGQALRQAVFPTPVPTAGRDPGADGAAQEEVEPPTSAGRCSGARTPSKRLCIHWIALDALTRAGLHVGDARKRLVAHGLPGAAEAGDEIGGHGGPHDRVVRPLRDVERRAGRRAARAGSRRRAGATSRS